MMATTHLLDEPPPLSFWARTAPLVKKADDLVHKIAERLMPVADLMARYWVASAFFASGLTKTLTGSFTLFGHTFTYPVSVFPTESTFTLFQYEYQVPLLPPTLAAYMGTATELLLPVFLLLGLGTRYAALVLFVFNAIAVSSYPELNEVGLKDHEVWGLLLFITFCHGPGKLSLDHWIGRLVRR